MLVTCPTCFALNVIFWTVFKTYSPTRSKICIDIDGKIFIVGWFHTGSVR